MAVSAATEPSCPFCDKKGLPILPVRYAVARADMGNAPALSAQFGIGIRDIALPADSACYTLRLLRPGYLYVFDEKRNEWTAFVVNVQSYLYQFDIHAKSPPNVPDKDFSEACARKGDPYSARCITVKDAKQATKVWLGFSDVMWTPDVLQKHSDVAYRKAHMQCIDVAQWRGGSVQPHMADFDALTKSVAEYALNPDALHKETQDYVTRYLPLPYKTPMSLLKANDLKAISSMSALMKILWPMSVGEVIKSGKAPSAAFGFSPHAMYLQTENTEGFIAWAKQASPPYKAGFIALSDPAGIAMELNKLALQRGLEFIDVPEQKWKFETSAAIDAVRGAVLNGAETNQSDQKKAAASILLPFVPAPMIRGNSMAEINSGLEDAGQLSPTEKNRLALESWPKYQKMYSEDKRTAFLKTYHDGLKNLDQNTIKPLDLAYVAWLKNAAFQTYFTHNFDPNHVNSGMAYLQTVYACIEDATGRNGSLNYFKECLEQDPTNPNAIILRALIANQNALAKKWWEAWAEKGQGHPMGTKEWIDISSKFYDAMKDTFVKGSMGVAMQHPFDNISKIMYQLAGPITSRLGEGLNKVVSSYGFSKMADRSMLLLIEGVVQAEHPNLIAINLSTMSSPKQAAKMLARAIAEISGGSAKNLYKSTERMLESPANQTYRMNGLFLIDKTQLQGLAGATNEARLGTVSMEKFDALFQQSTRSMVNAEVKAGVGGMIFAALTLASSYGELIKADAAAAVGARWNFASAVATLLGGLVQTAGQIMEKTVWSVVSIAKQIGSITLNMQFKASWLTGTGKWLGGAGGVISAGIMFKDGIDEFKFNWALGISMVLLGLGMARAAWWLTTAAAAAMTGVGFLVGVAITVIYITVSFLKTDDVQKWLDKTVFGYNKDGQFRSLVEQDAAMNKMAGA